MTLDRTNGLNNPDQALSSYTRSSTQTIALLERTPFCLMGLVLGLGGSAAPAVI